MLFTNKEMTFVTTWMKLEGIVLSEISQTEKGTYCAVSLICGIWGKKSQIKFRDTENRTVAARGWGCEKRQWVGKGTDFQL